MVIMDYPATDVTKFMLDGTEEYHELAQTFFHYVVWQSGGRAVPFDLQGAWASRHEFKATLFKRIEALALRPQKNVISRGSCFWFCS